MRLPELPPGLPDNYSYGKLLEELIKIGKFWQFFEIEDNKYPYWDKWKYVAREWKYDPQKLWAVVKSNRHGNSIRPAGKYLFRLNTPSVMQEYLHGFDMNLGGTLQSDGVIPDHERDRYLISSLMEEAIASSQLEGAVTTRKLAKEMLETNRKPGNESEQMILNNYEAMKWIVANKDKSFTEANILELHRIITKNTLRDTADEGAFRKGDDVNVIDVQTGEIVHRPPSHEELPALMRDLCAFANDKQKAPFFIHPITKGIILHFLLAYIHPFADGNGRTARTLFYWYLVKKGYRLIEYMSVSRVILRAKAQYARAYLYTEIDNNDLTYFILYNLRCIKVALDELRKYIERKTLEKKRVVMLLRNTQFNERQIRVLQDILHDQTSGYTVNQLEQWFNVSNQTVRNDLNQLVSAGLLQFRKAGKQLLFFPVKDVLTRINKLSG